MATALLVTAQGVGAVAGALALPALAERFGRSTMLRAALFAVPVLLLRLRTGPEPGLRHAGVRGGGRRLHLRAVRTQHRGPAAGPGGGRGRILGIYMMGLGIVYPIGAVLQGWMANTHGVRAVTVAGAVVLFAVLVLAAVCARRSSPIWPIRRPSTARPAVVGTT